MNQNSNQYHRNILFSCIKNGSIDNDKWYEIKTDLDDKNIEIQLEGVVFSELDLSGIILNSANLKGAKFLGTNLSRSQLGASDLSDVEFVESKIIDVSFTNANLSDSDFKQSDITDSRFIGTDLSDVTFFDSDLSHANFYKANLSGVILNDTITENTNIKHCYIDINTDTRNNNLNNINFSDGAKQTFEYVNRRLNWHDWYQKHIVLQIPVRFFWELSDYGRSIKRVLLFFFLFSYLFSVVYCFYPNALDGLIPLKNGEILHLNNEIKFIRSFYFSIVTMTTLGFGDVYANPESIMGYILLIVQVSLGYLILGALITCLSIMFTSDGPAQPLEEDLDRVDPRTYYIRDRGIR